MNERKQKFCEEMAKGLEPERAAVLAGYNPRTAAYWARQMLAQEPVVQEIERIKCEAPAAEGEILQFLTAVMRGEVQDGEPDGGKPPKVSERTKAAELLGRNQRLFSDKDKRGDGEAVVRIIGAEELAE